MSIRGGQPVYVLVSSWSLRAGIERERTVGITLEVFVLGAERVTLEVVSVEEMLVVVQGQRPEAVDRWLLSGSERNFVVASAGQFRASAVIVGVEILRLGRPVVEHVRFGRAGPVEVIDPKLRVVGRAIPAIAGRVSVVLPQEERLDHTLLGLNCSLD